LLSAFRFLLLAFYFFRFPLSSSPFQLSAFNFPPQLPATAGSAAAKTSAAKAAESATTTTKATTATRKSTESTTIASTQLGAH
jgi:hypothetical protein